MATHRGSNRGRRGRNNNPEGRNQYSGIISTARDNPLATAAAVGGAVAAGLFLWSRRNQLNEQIGTLTEQINEWREGIGQQQDALGSEASSESGSGRRTQTEIAEEALTLKETGSRA